MDWICKIVLFVVAVLMGKHSRKRESVLKRRRERRRTKRNKVKKLLRGNSCITKQLEEGHSALEQMEHSDSNGGNTSDHDCSVFDHLRVIDGADTVTPLEQMEHSESNDGDDTSDCSVFDHLRVTDAADTVTPQTTRNPNTRNQQVDGSSVPIRTPFEEKVQKIPGYAVVCKELNSTDPLEVGFELWKRQGATKDHFSFLNQKCEYF